MKERGKRVIFNLLFSYDNNKLLDVRWSTNNIYDDVYYWSIIKNG